MKAMVLHDLGGPDKLSYEDVPEPEPGPGETVVRLHAAALNRRDLYATYGQYPGVKPDILPSTPGSDGSGEVAARGDGAAGPDEGTEVVINRALVTRGGVSEGETVVVPGVGGGVATFMVQIAAAFGARVFVTSGSDEKIEKAKGLGAEGGVNYNSEDWSKELKSMAGGVDLSVDHVGGEAFNALVSLAKPGGRIVAVGATAGPAPKVTTIRISLKNLDVLGTAMGTSEEFGAMLDLYAENELHPTINETFPLEETPKAMQYMEEGEGMGKIVIDMPA